MRFFTKLLAILMIPSAAFALSFEEAFPDHPGYDNPEVMAFLNGMDFKRGWQPLPGGQAGLEVPAGFYYLDPRDAETVLVDIWGNPNGDSLGMIFPSGITPFDYESWGATLTWDESGYVSDEGAEEIDYDDLLKQMQRDSRDSNSWRRENGYPEVEIVGWAADPHYDQTERKLHWAQELDFLDSEVNTLNYYLRALGRKGVLELNFIADINQLNQVSRAIPEVSAMVKFNEGSRYEDFIPGVDTIAAVGIGGLIAGKVVAKTGLFLVALVFLKKFAIFLIIPALWLWRKLTGARRNS